MYGRAGLDRFKKAQSLEPYSVTLNSVPQTDTIPVPKVFAHSSISYSKSQISHPQTEPRVPKKPKGPDLVPSVVPSQVGGGQSTWQSPDWAIDPRPGVYYLEVLKDGEVLDRINLEKRKHIFGRQLHTCDFVLDHQSVSRQHAAVAPHKNGSIYVVDLGSVNGTFVASERLTKETHVELDVGQSLYFAASTRIYILRKNNAALFPPALVPAEINLPSSSDPSDEESVLAYKTFLNRYGLSKSTKRSTSTEPGSASSGGRDVKQPTERAAKRIRKRRVAFRDQIGGELVDVVGFSDGADVETEPGPLGVKEGSLVGKYKSLIQITIIPKGKERASVKETNVSQRGVTDKSQEVLNKVKDAPRSGVYDDLYGDSFAGKVGSSWAHSSVSCGDRQSSSIKDAEHKDVGALSGKPANNFCKFDDDLFGY